MLYLTLGVLFSVPAPELRREWLAGTVWVYRIGGPGQDGLFEFTLEFKADGTYTETGTIYTPDGAQVVGRYGHKLGGRWRVDGRILRLAYGEALTCKRIERHHLLGEYTRKSGKLVHQVALRRIR